MLFLLQQTETMSFTRTVKLIAGTSLTLIQRGEILGAVHFPRNMETDHQSRHPVNVVVYTECSRSGTNETDL